MDKETNLSILKPHDFTIKLNSLKKLADDKKEINKLEMFKEEDKFLIFSTDYHAKGKDLNKLAKWAQNEFKKINEELQKHNKELIEIIDCIATLDKDYIQAINLNSAEARAIAEDARKNSDKLQQVVKEFKCDYDELKEKIDFYSNDSKYNFAKTFIENNSWIIIIFLTLVTMFSFIVNILFLIGVIK